MAYKILNVLKGLTPAKSVNAPLVLAPKPPAPQAPAPAQKFWTTPQFQQVINQGRQQLNQTVPTQQPYGTVGRSNPNAPFFQQQTNVPYTVFGQQPNNYTPMVQRTVEPEYLPITAHSGRVTPIPLKDRGWLGAFQKGGYFADILTSLGREMSAIGARTGMDDIGKGLTSWVGGLSAKFGAAKYLSSNPNQVKANPESTKYASDIDPVERQAMINDEVAKRTAGSNKAEEGFKGMWTSFWNQVGRKETGTLIPVERGTVDRIGDYDFKVWHEQDKVDWMTPYEYYTKKADADFQLAKGYFQEFKRDPRADTIQIAETMGWKPPKMDDSFGAKLLKGIVTAIGPSSVQNPVEISASDFILNKSQDLTDEAFTDLTNGNVIDAQAKRAAAINLERSAGGKTGLYDPYFAYTWITSPKREEEFINTVASMEMQLGRPMTNFEVWKARDSFVDPWKEFAGDVLFDWTNVLGGVIEEPVRQLVKNVSTKVTTEIAQSTTPLLRPARFLVANFGKKAVRSTANNLSHTANEIFMGIAHTIGISDSAGDAFVEKIGRIGTAVADGLPTGADMSTVLDLPAEFAGRQERKLLGLSNVFNASEDLADSAIAPTMWSQLAEDARKKLSQEALELEQARLLRKGLTPDVAAEQAAQVAKKIANDPKKITTYMATAFRDEYLRAMSTAETAAQRTANRLFSTWANMVLSLRPAWMFRNYADNMIRSLIFGSNPLEGLDLLAGRLGNMPDIAERLRQVGMLPPALSESFARSALNTESETVLQRAAAGWKPNGFWDFFNVSGKEAAKKSEFSAKWADLMLGKTIEDGVETHTITKLGRAAKAAGQTIMGTLGGGISDWNNAIETAFKLRMFEKQLYDNMRQLSVAGKRLTMDNLISMGASQRVQNLVGTLWDIYYMDPSSLRAALRELKVGDSPMLKVVSSFTPANLDEVLGALDPERRLEFMAGVIENMRRSMETARLSGKEFDPGGFFDGLMKDFNDNYKTQILNKPDLRDAPNANPKLSNDVDVDVTPSNGAAPHKAGPTIFTETKKPKFEAATDLRTARNPKTIASNLRDSIGDRWNIQQGEANAVHVLDDGKVTITLSPGLAKQRNQEVRQTITDLMATGFEAEGRGSKDDILLFWSDPKRLMKEKPEIFQSLSRFFDDEPDLRKAIAGLQGKKSLDYLKAMPTPDLIQKDLTVVLEAGAKKVDIKDHYTPETSAAARKAAAVNVTFHDAIVATTDKVRWQYLKDMEDQYDFVMSGLQWFTSEVYPGYRRIQGWTAMRELAWDQRQDMLQNFWTSIAKQKSDLLSATEGAGEFPTLGDILGKMGYSFEFSKDGSLRRLLYAPLDPRLGDRGTKRIFATNPAPTDKFLRRFFGERTVNDGSIEKLIKETPYTRDVAKGIIPDTMDPVPPMPTTAINEAIEWTNLPPVPPATPTPAKALPAKVKEAVEKILGKEVTPDGTKKIVQKYDTFTREDYVGLLEETLKPQEVKDIMALEDTLAAHYAMLSGDSVDDYFKRMVVDNGLADDGVGLYDSRWYYSQLDQAIEKMPNKMSAEQFRGFIKGKVKGAEWQSRSVDHFLSEHPNFTKQELTDYLAENDIQLEEKILSNNPAVIYLDKSAATWGENSYSSPQGGKIFYQELTLDNQILGDVESRPDGSYRAYVIGDQAHTISRDFLTEQEAKDFVFEQAPQPRRVQHLGDLPQYEAVNLPGGTNYREILFHYDPPSGENFNAPHFGDYSQNLLGHVRMDDRIDDQGRKVLNIVEVQSDWNQRGRKVGYAEPVKGQDVLTEQAQLNDQITRLDDELENLTWLNPEWSNLNNAMDNAEVAWDQHHNQGGDILLHQGRDAYREWEVVDKDLLAKRREARQALRDYEHSVPEITNKREERHNLTRRMNELPVPGLARLSSGVPHNPFEKNWPQVFMKRMLNYASENGYDVVTFPTGPVAAKIEGHQIVEQIDQLAYNEKTHVLHYRQQGGGWQSKANVMPEEIKDNVGDDIAKQLLAQPVQDKQYFAPFGGTGQVIAGKSPVDYEGLVGSHVLDTKDVVFGGEKMRPFYDEILPNTVNDLLKKHGLQVEDINIPSLNATNREFRPITLDEARQLWNEQGPDSIEIQFIKNGKPLHENNGGWGTYSNANFDELRDLTKLPGREVNFRAVVQKGENLHGFTLNDSLTQAAKAGQPLFDLRGAKKLGSTQWLEDGRALTKIFTGEADKYTFVHETAHRLLPLMPDEDIATVTEWLKTEHNLDMPDRWQFGHTQHQDAKEIFADAFLTYVSEGKAPNARLKGVFERFKDWLVTIYKGLTGRQEPKLNDEMRGLFDKWLAETPVQPKKMPAARPRRNMLINDVQDLMPDEQQVVNDALDKQRRTYATRSKLAQPVTAIKDPKAAVMVQNEAQEMMLDVFGIDGFEGTPMMLADFKEELVRRFPWAKEIENDLPASRMELMQALEHVVAGTNPNDPLVKKLRHLVIHNLENGVTDDGNTVRIAHPYMHQQLEAEQADVDKLIEQWSQGMKRSPLDELDKAVEARANRQAFWDAFVQQRWSGDKSIAQAWGQFARTPELFIAHLRDLMENLPEGVSSDTIEGIQLLAFQVQNFYAISNNFADKMGLLRSARNEAFSVIPQSRSVTRLPANFQTWFNQASDGAAQVSGFEQAMKTWKDYAVGAKDAPVFQMDGVDLNMLDNVADRASRNKQTILNVAAYGAEDDLFTQIQDTLGIVVNKKMTAKKVGNKWVDLDEKELGIIERLKNNLAEQQTLLAGIENIPQGALPRTNRYMIDYGDYTKFDEMMKKVFPFWTFTSRSVPFWMETMMTHPQIISAYQKYMALNRRIQKQNGIYTTTGEPMPSLEGYVPIPGTDLWFNPTASFSFRYLLPNYQYTMDEYSELPIANQVLGYIYEMANLTNVGLSPFLTVPFHMFGWDKNNGQPVNSVVPQVGLLPPWWTASMRNAVYKATGEGTFWGNAAELALGSEQPWKDYMVERRVLANGLSQLQDASSTQERNKIIQDMRSAFLDRENSTLWNETLRDLDKSELGRNWLGYMTGTYTKDFSDEEIDFQRLRDEVNALRAQVNDEVGAVLFGVDGSAEERYKKYSDKLYRTPEGYAAIMYNSMRYNRSETGQPLYYDERRADIAQKINKEENTRAYYDKLNELQKDFQAALLDLPVGEDSPLRDKLFEDYFAARTAIDTDPMFADVTRDWATGYKPESMIYDHFENVWWKLIDETKPKYDPTTDTYDEYMQKVAAWEASLPNQGTLLSKELTAAIQEELKTNPEDYDKLLLSGYELAGGRTLDINALISNLQKNTDADRYQYWRKAKDNGIDALDAAWTELYWSPYWESLKGLTSYDRDIAEQEFLNNHPKPTEAELIDWVMNNYPQGQFKPEDLQRFMSGRDVKSVEERLAPKTEAEAMGQRIWDILSQAGPNKKDLKAEFRRLGGDDSQLDMWYESGGNPAAWKDASHFEEIYNRLVQAAKNLGISNTPTVADMTEWKQAKQLDDELVQLYKDNLGEDYMDVMVAYWNANSRDRKAMRSADPRIDRYYQIQEFYGERNPLWAKYYSSSTSSSSGSSGSSGGGGGGGGYSGSRKSSYSYNRSYNYSRSSGSYSYTEPKYTLGMGKRSDLDAMRVPFSLGKGGATPGIKIPAELKKVIGDTATKVIEEGRSDDSTLKYVDEVVKRHPDLVPVWETVKKEIEPPPQLQPPVVPVGMGGSSKGKNMLR